MLRRLSAAGDDGDPALRPGPLSRGGCVLRVGAGAGRMGEGQPAGSVCPTRTAPDQWPPGFGVVTVLFWTSRRLGDILLSPVIPRTGAFT